MVGWGGMVGCGGVYSQCVNWLCRGEGSFSSTFLGNVSRWDDSVRVMTCVWEVWWERCGRGGLRWERCGRGRPEVGEVWEGRPEVVMYLLCHANLSPFPACGALVW